MKKENGITLIALVITIIVLIILAGVGINLTLGDNGILRRAQDAQKLSDKATVKEKVEVAIVEVQVEEVTSTGRLTLQKLYETLESKDSNITLNEYTEGDTELTGTYTLNGKTYSIVINNEFKVEVEDAGEVEAKPIKFGELVWNADGTVSVDATTELTGTIEYQVNGTDGEWQTGTLPTNLQHGDKLYVRVNDGTTTTEPQMIEIKDTTLPEEFTISVPEEEITYESLKITSEGTEDNQTGIRDYSFIVTKDGTVVKETKNQTLTECTIEGLAAETEYVVYMLAYDKAGNERKSNEVTVTTKSMPVVELIGKSVNYSANEITNWQVLYIEEDYSNPNCGNIYIITSDLLPQTKVPTGTTGITRRTDYVKNYWPTVPAYQEITAEVKQKFMYKWTGTDTNRINIQCISTLLNTNSWQSFANGVSGTTQIENSLAVGAPTLEMILATYNKLYTNANDKIAYKTGMYGYGYQMKVGSSSNYSDNVNVAKNNTLLVPMSSRQNIYGGYSGSYWLASPGDYYSGGGEYILCVSTYTNSGSFSVNWSSGYSGNNSCSGIRPVVCIPNTYKLQLNSETGIYDIVEK